jgi:hypothetical protein
MHICDERLHETLPYVEFASTPSRAADIVITDGWPSGAEAMAKSLTVADLDCMGMPMLLATPLFSIGREIAFDPVQYPASPATVKSRYCCPCKSNSAIPARLLSFRIDAEIDASL